MSWRMISKLNVESVMLNTFPWMRSLDLGVVLEPTIHVIIPVVVGLSILFVWWTGCALSPQLGSTLTF
ncbi:hypothetical protein OIU84_030228 [Salix udensis]|uniref:Uncharacterized protein n=1 Tax=Salix udensis TaxID=889485 RepID=A0AAD6KBJ0_9ROSI|nr:hypothetical protein OIU84_030228 [Salix udensis]